MPNFKVTAIHCVEARNKTHAKEIVVGFDDAYETEIQECELIPDEEEENEDEEEEEKVE